VQKLKLSAFFDKKSGNSKLIRRDEWEVWSRAPSHRRLMGVWGRSRRQGDLGAALSAPGDFQVF